MYPQPVPAERPDSVTRGAYAASVTAVAQLLTTAGTVGFTTWTSTDDDSTTGVSVFFVVWGVISASLLILTLRGRNGGRVLFHVVGIIGLLNHLACGVYNGIAGAEIQRLSTNGSDHPPMWLAVIGMTGSVLGLTAAIAGLVHYGRRSSRDWLKPPPPPLAYIPVPPRR